MMRDSLLIGVVLGLVGGALLFKHSPAAKDIVNKGEKAVKQEINSIAKELEKQTAAKTTKN